MRRPRPCCSTAHPDGGTDDTQIANLLTDDEDEEALRDEVLRFFSVNQGAVRRIVRRAATACWLYGDEVKRLVRGPSIKREKVSGSRIGEALDALRLLRWMFHGHATAKETSPHFLATRNVGSEPLGGGGRAQGR